ncbi:MAG: hypothetical protein ACTHJW_10190 [Streptosporangiaceae bacterium]
MSTFISPRLRKPAVSVLAGVLFAAAWLIRGGPLWWVAILSLVAATVRAISLYTMGGKDTDEGALAGSRADERQKLLSIRSRALACNLAAVTAFVGLTVTIAVKSPAVWPFLVVLAAIILGYLFGLSNYGGDDDEDPAADADTSHSTPSPVR